MNGGTLHATTGIESLRDWQGFQSVQAELVQNGGTIRSDSNMTFGIQMSTNGATTTVTINDGLFEANGHIYLGNAPKYIIDGIVSDEAQTCFNIVFMPALVVALLSSFIFNPVLKKIGCLWVDGKIAELRKLVLKLTLIPVAIDAAVVAAGVLAGLPVLGFVYGVDVSAYMGELVVALLASGVMAMLNLYVALLTTMRKQPHILGAYTAGTLILVAFGRLVLKETGLLPLCWMYLAVMSLVVIYCMIVYAVTIRKHS